MKRIARCSAVLFLLLSGVVGAAPELGRIEMLPVGTGRNRAASSTDSVQAGAYYVINDPAGFPVPAISGEITLPAGSYAIPTSINIGTNQIVITNGEVILTGPGRITGTGTRVLDVRTAGTLRLHDLKILATAGNGGRLNAADGSVFGDGNEFVAPSGKGFEILSGLVFQQSTTVFAGSATAIDHQSGDLVLDQCGIYHNAVGISITSTPTSVSLNGKFLSAVPGATFVSVNTSSPLSEFFLHDSPLTVSPGQTGVVATLTSFTSEHFALFDNTCTGGGTCLSGITNNDIQSRFSGNLGIADTFRTGAIMMSAGATATNLSTTYTKLLGTTTTVATSQFTATNNRLTYNGPSGKTYAISCQDYGSTSVASGDFFTAAFKNGVTQVTPDAFSRANSNTTTSVISSITSYALNNGDFVECFKKVGSGTPTFTWISGSLTVTPG